MEVPNILIGGTEWPKSGWAVIFAGGSASGKSTLIRNGRMRFEGETLSTDTAGEDIVEVHNNAGRYAETDPKRLVEAEKLILNGCKSRYGKPGEKKGFICCQNVRIDLDCITTDPGFMSTVLSNGAHARKETLFKQRIRKAKEEGLRNLMLDMTGKEKEVVMYLNCLKESGYKVALVWVITNRTQAMIWNLLRPRRMKVDAVHGGHDEPNKYLLGFLQDERAELLDDAWLVFNSTERVGREMTDTEFATSAVRLKKCGKGFAVAKDVAERVNAVTGPCSPKAASDSEMPQWQKDEKGREPIVIDADFVEKYTREVTLDDGTKARALLQLRATSKPKEGGLIVRDDETGEPKLQKCNKEDTPTYPYVIITEADYGKNLQRRHGMMGGYKLKCEKSQGGNIAKYCSDDWTYKTFDRIRMMRKVARDKGVDVPRFEDVFVSLLDADKAATEANIKEFYRKMGVKEPDLPKKPDTCYPVNEPVREQFLGRNGERDYQEAVERYPIQKAAYEKALAEWSEYYKKFE